MGADGARAADVTILRHQTAADFLSATHALRRADPLLTNIMGSVATGVVGGRTYDSEMWLTVHDDGHLVGMAMRTAPWNLAVSAMPAQAAEELGRYVAMADPDLPGVIGPGETVDAVVTGIAPTAGRRPRTRMVDVLRVLTSLRPPRGVPGVVRGARAEDTALLVQWHHGFADDAGLPAHDLEESVLRQVSDGALWIWEVDAVPVAMAGHAPIVATPVGAVARIGPVFTSAESRGRGYGSAVTAAVAQELLPHCGTVMLFADAAKPEVNRLYERLGFVEAARIVEVALDG
jgi:predicted GNAT family acetyltransferase